MLAFPFLLLDAARDAGMSVPELGDDQTFDREQFPHFAVFCTSQLGRAMEPGEHWENAKVIAKVPESRIRTITLGELRDLGLRHPHGS